MKNKQNGGLSLYKVQNITLICCLVIGWNKQSLKVNPSAERDQLG